MEQLNVTEANRTAAINAGNTLEADKINKAAANQIALFESQQEFERQKMNANVQNTFEQANKAWLQQIATRESAAQDAAYMQSAGMTHGLSMQEQGYVYQSMRDSAAFNQQTTQNEAERAMQRMAALYGNTELMDSGSGREMAARVGDALEMIIFGRNLPG